MSSEKITFSNLYVGKNRKERTVVEGELFEVACVDHSVPTPAWNASAISDISDNRLSIHMILDIHCHQSVIVRPLGNQRTRLSFISPREQKLIRSPWERTHPGYTGHSSFGYQGARDNFTFSVPLIGSPRGNVN
ncbi:hypothetical protein F2P81_022307 [Scophthalmus maximus]|uniref:Uncharacterized protein n=1 Tax=Scophthalmus maximus TaxID=52904 RepID=A0A6A4RRZ5_SCOMX|nr:hypothetical protein F2P81_022307 [Scophthalmus maximus]